MNLPLLIARRNLLRQQGSFSSFIIRLAIIATALSVAVMLLALAFISGFKYEIREKIFSFWGHIHITEYNPNVSSLINEEPIVYDPDLVRRVSQLPGVVQIAPYAVRPAILQHAGTMEGIKLKGINSATRLSTKINMKGALPDFQDTAYARNIVLSQVTADRLQLHLGDALQLNFLEPGALAPRIRKVTISGIYHTGMEEIDRDYAICDLRLLQRMNHWSAGQINGYQIDLADDAQADTLAAIIYHRFVAPPLATSTMRDIFQSIFDWLELQNVNVQIVISIMAIVAIINLAVALVILIVDRARMIGVLTALGLSQGRLQQVFLWNALLVAALGVLLGNALALGLCALQRQFGLLKLSEATYYMKQAPVRVIWWHVVVVDAATLLLCALCLWLPSRYIRRIQPARVLQFK